MQHRRGLRKVYSKINPPSTPPKPLSIACTLINRGIAALRLAVEKKAPLDPKNLRLQAVLNYLARAMPKA